MSSKRGYDPETGVETIESKFVRKFKENPWVPLGCFATCGALIMSAMKLRQGNSSGMNFWLRARVGLQGLTILAVLGGTMSYRSKAKEQMEAGRVDGLPSHEANVAMNRDAKRDVDRAEFEERLRDAEATHEAEKGWKRK